MVVNLTRTQFEQIQSLMNSFPTVDQIKLVTAITNGIGPSTHVMFTYASREYSSDITDVSNW